MAGIEATEPRFPIRDAPDIELDAAGFAHPGTSSFRQAGFTRYRDVTHVAVSDRGIWVATEDDLLVVPRSRFEREEDASRVAEALRDRIAALPGGEQALARMAGLDAVGTREGPARAVQVLAALCVVGFLLEILISPETLFVGEFSPRLVRVGELWRIATGNLLHGNVPHIAANLFALFVLGRVVERDLGSVRTVCLMGVSAASAMLLSGALEDHEVVGVSGVVLGLGGALVWVELYHRHEQPAWWRFTRRLRHLLLGGLVADLLLGFSVQWIAGTAHMGGLLGGGAAAAWLTRAGLRQPATGPQRTLAVWVVALSVASIVWAGAELARGDYVARHIAKLTELPGVPVAELNKVAWLTAVDEKATRAELRAALHLAERAVHETGEQDAGVLDTLAEVQFHLGRPFDALVSIDKAIALQPELSYFREQRRRYTGERPAHDRPPDPALPPPSPLVPPLPLDEMLKGVVRE